MKFDITSRTIAGFLLMAGLLAIVSLGAILYINRLQRVTESTFDYHISSLLATGRLEAIIWDQRRSMANFLLTEDEEWVERLLRSREDFGAAHQQARTTAQTPQEQEALSRIDTLYAGFAKVQEAAIAHQRAGQSRAAREVLSGAHREQIEALLEACRNFRQFNERLIEGTRDRLARDNATARWALYGVAGVGVLIGGLLGLVIARSVLRPIAELVLKVSRADGTEEIVERLELSEGKVLESLEQGVESLIRKTQTASADLAQSQEMLVQAEKLAVAGQLAAGIAHEIRNPLAAIKTMVFALRTDLPPEDPRRTDFDIMGEEIEQMERSIQRFLDFARPQAPAFTPVSLRQALANAAALLARKAQGQGVQVEVRAEPDLVVRADRRQIEQVFVNLMLNALQAMPEGGRLAVAVHQADGAQEEHEDRGWAEVVVTDTGTGIPEELIDCIFEPFVTGREGGVGLGLAIVRKIVEQHRGQITAQNLPAGGVAFTVKLPLMEGGAG